MPTSTPLAVLIVNLGTPDSPEVGDVRSFLREFLMDGRVIDISYPARFALVQGIIAPFRAPKSAVEYKKLWTDKGSPLFFHGVRVKELLQKALGENCKVYLGMRYQNPSLPSVLEEIKRNKHEKIFVLPMFPQYASSTTGSVMEEVYRNVSSWLRIPSIYTLDAYPDHPKMIQAFVEIAKKFLKERSWDQYVFTYHGLPERHLRKEDSSCLKGDCCSSFHQGNRLCYRAQCFQTSKALAKALGIHENQYTVCFQSRLGRDPWLQPYTEDIVKSLASEGKKNVLVFTPAFVADCLETTVEVAETYGELFEELSHGGRWQMVDSLNDHPLWIDALKELVLQNIPSNIHV